MDELGCEEEQGEEGDAWVDEAKQAKVRATPDGELEVGEEPRMSLG